MARFQSGTLGRSIKRFGRFRSPMGSFKRKSHQWKYIESLDTAASRNTTSTSLVLFDGSDWVAPTGSGSGVKNIAIDLVIGLTWSPEITTLAYDSWSYRWGIWALDVDDGTALVADMFGSARAIEWGFTATNSGEQPTALGVSPDSRSMRWSARAKQRFLRNDEELRFMGSFTSTVTETLADARLHIFGRVSWETP